MKVTAYRYYLFGDRQVKTELNFIEKNNTLTFVLPLRTYSIEVTPDLINIVFDSEIGRDGLYIPCSKIKYKKFMITRDRMFLYM